MSLSCWSLWKGRIPRWSVDRCQAHRQLPTELSNLVRFLSLQTATDCCAFSLRESLRPSQLIFYRHDSILFQLFVDSSFSNFSNVQTFTTKRETSSFLPDISSPPSWETGAEAELAAEDPAYFASSSFLLCSVCIFQRNREQPRSYRYLCLFPKRQLCSVASPSFPQLRRVPRTAS